MIAQGAKDIYFLIARILAFPNVYVCRWRYRRPSTPEGHYVHLGCGEQYLCGMINVDGNIRRRRDALLDLRNPLPFPSSSCAVVYMSHVLEHFLPADAIRLLREVRRIVGNGGVFRVVVPSWERAMDIAARRGSSTYPRSFGDPVAQAINYLFCDGQHKYAYNFSLLAGFLMQSGFSRVLDLSEAGAIPRRQYGRVALGGEEVGSLVVEARP